MSKETDKVEETTEQSKEISAKPSLMRNVISFVGFAIVAASLTSITLLILMELTGSSENPYRDLVTFIFIPSILVFGLLVVLAGVLLERRRRRSLSADEIAAYPILDLNDPGRRRSLLVFMCLAFAFLFMSAFGSYRAFEYTESVTFCGEACHDVMEPEFVAYKSSPHARVACVECHVGGGAEAYVRSKFTGMRQLYGVVTGHFSRPIETPVHNMRSATATCQSCHWSERYNGDQIKVFTHYEYDEQNTPRQARMLIHVGGGSPEMGPVGGIHWHMNVANEVSFISDAKRENIPWVRVKNSSGEVVEYRTAEYNASPSEVEAASKRVMDCIDCHNRPAHDFMSPNQAVDRSLDAERLDRGLPYLKAKAVETLSRPYANREEAMATIESDLTNYYRDQYPDVFAAKGQSVATAVKEIQQIYRTYFFPEMKTDWQAHPNNIGHLTAQGCFRCHDGRHFSNDGKVIRNECSICHTTIDQTFAGTSFVPPNGLFKHPVDLGDRNTWQCAVCHKGDGTFKHPLNLGDISRFQCAECHKPKAGEPVRF